MKSRISKTSRTLRTAAVAGGAGVLLLATPALADSAGTRGGGPGPGPGAGISSTCEMDGTGNGGFDNRGNSTGDGLGSGMGQRRGSGMRGGMTGDRESNLPAQGTLTGEQRTTLAAMAEEEKLSHDVYTALASTTGDARFSRVAASESRHLDAVRVLMTRYGVTDPTVGKADGQFTTDSVQKTYDSLIADGKVSLDAALGVGRTVETTDIADLTAALSGLDAADVKTVYSRLLAASQHHLAAFGG